VDAMNYDIARRFREKMSDADEVYILGDIFGKNVLASPFELCMKLMESLGIRERPFHLVLGNHDILTDEEYVKVGFASVKRLDFIDLGGMRTMLTHDPCMVQPVGTLALCGHVHALFSENWQPARNTFTINVSVEMRNYAPVSEAEIVDIVRRSDYMAQ
jgi:calcineurin-like phosphoesterase family protein